MEPLSHEMHIHMIFMFGVLAFIGLMFLQSIMLSAIEHGLATCPQAALGEYPEIVREELCYSQDKVLLCGMAIGYEDKSAIVNSYRTPREELDKIVRYFP